MSRDTQMMQQWRELKAQHQNAILLYRCGDFYEMFYEDAEVGSRVLGLTLTARNNGGAAEVPLAGVPVRALNEYLRRLVKQGFRVAICEQVEDPREAKGIVRRAVVETVTPGVAYSDDLLDGARNNFLCALYAPVEKATGGLVGVAAVDISTGELRLATAAPDDVGALLARLAPREVIVPANGTAADRSAALRGGAFAGREAPLLTEREGWEFDPSLARDDLAQHYGLLSLDGLGIESADEPALCAAGALLRYVREMQPAGVPQLARPHVERPGRAMPLDEMTRRNLELVESLRGGDDVTEKAGTLLGVLDRTLTPMGARLLRQWMLAPLAERTAIDARLDAVAALAADPVARAELREALDGVRDVERLASKAAAARATPRELRSLGDSVGRLPRVEAVARRLAAAAPALAVPDILRGWDACADIASLIVDALVERPPVAIGVEEPAIRSGFDHELDELRALRDGGKDAIARIEADERARTGIQSLKIGYNKVFGYFIRVTAANQHLVPSDYQRRQTLAGEERYVTPALKDYEERVLSAAERIEERERDLFERLRASAGGAVRRFQASAAAAAALDVLASFAEVAEREGYTRPVMTDELDLDIVAGRHPVVERMMPRDKFIPNDVRLTPDARLVILTGPNMAGKSTILRQIGLIVLMAQMGSFVPAARARIGICDRVFTRVGASDNLVRGQSTFMVEMAETSAILHTASRRSLVLLDEIGRGTSTYDGVSIAWAVTEHLHDRVGCKAVFATHYHELTQLADELDAVRNFNVVVREVGDQVLFLHRLQPGGADRSYGIEVGRLAGLPAPVIARARAVLALLEGEELTRATPKRSRGEAGTAAGQLALFGAEPHPVVERLKATDANNLTPMQALALLSEMIDQANA